MYVEFLDDVGSWTKGSMDDLKENLARSLIAIGQARECSAAEFLRSSMDVEAQKRNAKEEAFRDEMRELVRSSLQTKGIGNNGKPKQPPNGGGGVDFDRIEPGESSEERGPKRTFTDALRCIALQGGQNVPSELREYASKRLRNVYADGVCHYEVDDETGQISSTVTRSMADGGMETIRRTGTDSISGGATYGFALKPEYLGDVFQIAMEQGVFSPAARSIPITQGLEVKYPALDQYSAPTKVNGVMNAAVFAGITLAYKGEVTKRDSSDATMNMIDFKAVDLTGMTDFSRDFIVDNYNAMDSRVTQLFGQAFGWVEDWMSIQGDGNGKPQGFFNSSALISGGGISGNATREVANKITIGDLLWMISRTATMCWQGLRFIANVTTIPQLGVLRDAAGTAVFQPNALVAQTDLPSIMKLSTYDRAAMMSRPMGTLIGFPIYFTEKVPTLGSTGDISLVCPDQFGIARRAGLEVGLSEHFYFDTDRIAYRFKLRHDMKSLWRGPYQQADGSATKVSPFVTLVHL